MTELTPTLLILGASTRAAAFSAMRAGLSPRCIDHFADLDLCSSCPVEHVPLDEGASGLLKRASRGKTGPWLYTGPLENHPEAIKDLSKTDPLLGNSPSVLKRVRDPLAVSSVLARHGLPHPEVRMDARGLPRDGSWFVKPVASGGGRAVSHWEASSPDPGEPSYFQQFVPGLSHSAIFLACSAGVELIGVTRQLVGTDDAPYLYGGSIGPIPLSPRPGDRLRRLGEILATSFGLKGLFGVDYIERSGDPWPVEINPRYTASVEIHELATGRALLRDHWRACSTDGPPLAPEIIPGNDPPRIIGKKILYARRSFTAPEIMKPADLSRHPFQIPRIADIPQPGTFIPQGAPIMTVYAEGESEAECLRALDARMEFWRTFIESQSHDDS